MKDHKCPLPNKEVITHAGVVSFVKAKEACMNRGHCQGDCWLSEGAFVRFQAKFKGDYLRKVRK